MLNTVIYEDSFMKACQKSPSADMGTILRYAKAFELMNPGNHEHIRSEQYNALLDAALKDENITRLQLKDFTVPQNAEYGKRVEAGEQTGVRMTLVDDHDQGRDDMYIVFRGTEKETGEWYDDALGMSEELTPDDWGALFYICEMASGGEYNLILSGHSRGGRYAELGALFLSFVDECYSFDGEGFSLDFINEYSWLIKRRKRFIHSYNYEGDYVSALMYDLAGDTHYITSGWQGIFSPEFHAPIYLFSDWTNFHMDTSGHPAFYRMYITSVTTWLMTMVPSDKLNLIADFVGQCLDAFFNDESQIPGIIEDNPEAVGALVAALSDCPTILATFTMLISIMQNNPALGPLLDGFIGFLIVGNRDAARALAAQYGVELDDDWFDHFEASFQSTQVGMLTGSDGLDCVAVRQDEVRDWSDERKQELLSIVDEVDAEPWSDVAHWDMWYRIEGLFGGLNVEDYQNNMETYLRKQIDLNGVSRQTIIDAFSRAEEHNSEYAGLMRNVATSIKEAAAKIVDLT